MKNIQSCLLLLCFILLGSYSIAQTPANDNNWNTDTLTMPLYDNFNGTSLDATKWNVGIGYPDSATTPLTSTNGLTYSSGYVTISTGSTDLGIAVGQVIELENITGITSTPSINGTAFTVTSVSTSAPWTFTFQVTSISGTWGSNGCVVGFDNYSDNLPQNDKIDGQSHLILITDYNASRPNGKVLHYGAISSTKLFSYGYYEIRSKMNSKGCRMDLGFWEFNGAGTGSCGDVGYLGYSENDFYETTRWSNTDSTWNLSSCVHSWKNSYPSCEDDSGINQEIADTLHDTNLYANYHTYGYEFDRGRILYYKDGVQYNARVGDKFVGYPLDSLWLEVSVEPINGINNGVQYSYTGTTYLGPSPYINEMTVDYVKVYNLKLSGANCSSLTNNTTTNFNPSTFTYELYNNITINGTATYGSGVYETLRAVNNISISGSFVVPSGSSLLLLQTPCN
jgi:hypothetical protein